MDPRDLLLSRYLGAARTMADAAVLSLVDDGGSSPASGSPASGSPTSGSPTPDGETGVARIDAQGTAMAELLQRQAVLLVRLHESSTGGAIRQPHGVYEELLQRRLDDVASTAYSKFYSYRYDRVPYHWRCLYTHSLILSTHHHILRALTTHGRLGEDALDLVVASLDRALITTGGAGRTLGAAWIEETLQALEQFCALGHETQQQRPRKRARTAVAPLRLFPDNEPHGRPAVSPDRACPRHQGWALDRFEDYMNQGGGGVAPVVFTDLMGNWPALTHRPWNQPDYLLSKTFGGRRLVPVEVGRSYVDQSWGQELIPFRQFLTKYVDAGSSGQPGGHGQVGYLAQHNLFHQVPSLRNDINIPDFCWCWVPADAASPPRVDVPQLNAWFGPARTITPLHTDGYHNLLCQVVGTKYVRLYPPCATPHMQPRGAEHGIDMSNTSALDLGVLEGWDECPDGTVDEAALRDMRERLQDVEYRECILGPGDTLLIPLGWWHYVRSLSISFSVSFWWS